jgi:hypothetical protein
VLLLELYKKKSAGVQACSNMCILVNEVNKVKSLCDFSLTFAWYTLYWVFKLKGFLDVNNLANLFVSEDVEGKSIIDQCKERFQVLENNKWFHNLWDDCKHVNGNKLRMYRLFKTELVSEEY